MEGVQTEVLRTSGVVQAVKQHDERRYSVKVGGEWYSGFGACPAEKGCVYVIDYALNGRFRNIRSIREVGEAVSAFEQHRPEDVARVEELPAVPVGARNYRTASGWCQIGITAEDEELIQAATGKRNLRIMSESLEDARRLLGQSGVRNAVSPRNVLELAVHLSERRTIHISKVYEEFLNAKVAAAHQRIAPPASAPVSGEAEA